jgi:hypothetical protein
MPRKATAFLLKRSSRKQDKAKCWQKAGDQPPCTAGGKEKGTDVLESWPALLPQIKYFIPAAQQFPS